MQNTPDTLLRQAASIAKQAEGTVLGELMEMFQLVASNMMRQDSFHEQPTKELTNLPAEERVVNEEDMKHLSKEQRESFDKTFHPIIQKTRTLSELLLQLVEEYGSKEELCKAGKVDTSWFTRAVSGIQTVNRNKLSIFLDTLYIYDHKPYLEAHDRLRKEKGQGKNIYGMSAAADSLLRNGH